MDTRINITEAAQQYLAELLSKQQQAEMAVRMFVTQPGTKYAETCLAYCRAGEEKPDDEILNFPSLKVYLERNSLAFLDEAEVDFQASQVGGQLTIKAPNAKLPKVNANSPIEERIRYVLYTEINPGLASHGGEVSLEQWTDDQVAVLKFGGGCQGCSAVDLTLKEGVEKVLMEQIPEIRAIRDVTDHSVTENAYYKG